jgi:hypothetical protein
MKPRSPPDPGKPSYFIFPKRAKGIKIVTLQLFEMVTGKGHLNHAFQTAEALLEMIFVQECPAAQRRLEKGQTGCSRRD